MTGTTRPGEVEAVDPVAAALFAFEGYDDPFEVALNADYNWPEHWVEEYRDKARAAVAAAYPVIAAAMREQVAQEIREEPCGACEGRSDCDDMADRIARGSR